MLRVYTRSVAAGLAALGIAGLLGLVEVSLGNLLLCFGVSAVFAYAAFWWGRAEDMRWLVGGVGALSLLSAVFLFLDLFLFGKPFDALEERESALRALFGILCILCASFLPQRNEERGT